MSGFFRRFFSATMVRRRNLIYHISRKLPVKTLLKYFIQNQNASERLLLMMLLSFIASIFNFGTPAIGRLDMEHFGVMMEASALLIPLSEHVNLQMRRCTQR